MKQTSLLLSLLLLPATAAAQDAQTLITNFTNFLASAVVPFLIGVAFLFFVINVVRYFVIGSTSQEGREKAKNLAIYGIAAFVLLIIFWGIVNLFVQSVGLGGQSAPVSDYRQQSGAPATTPGGNSNPTQGTSNPNTSCTQIQIDFDNQFGGPCATNGNTNP